MTSKSVFWPESSLKILSREILYWSNEAKIYQYDKVPFDMSDEWLYQDVNSSSCPCRSQVCSPWSWVTVTTEQQSGLITDYDITVHCLLVFDGILLLRLKHCPQSPLLSFLCRWRPEGGTSYWDRRPVRLMTDSRNQLCRKRLMVMSTIWEARSTGPRHSELNGAWSRTNIKAFLWSVIRMAMSTTASIWIIFEVMELILTQHIILGKGSILACQRSITWRDDHSSVEREGMISTMSSHQKAKSRPSPDHLNRHETLAEERRLKQKKKTWWRFNGGLLLLVVRNSLMY